MSDVIEVSEEPISGYFSLSYANYLVVNRAKLESMPDDWQRIFVGLLREMDREFRYLPEQPAINVQVLARAPERIVEEEDCAECEGTGDTFDEHDEPTGEPCSFCGGSGYEYFEERYETPDEVGRIKDPIPHYDRTRTRLPRISEDPATYEGNERRYSCFEEYQAYLEKLDGRGSD